MNKAISDAEDFTFSTSDLVHVWRMLANDNKGQKLTETMIVGLEAGLIFYLRALPERKPANVATLKTAVRE